MDKYKKALVMCLGAMMKSDMDYFKKYPTDLSPLTEEEHRLLRLLEEEKHDK